MRVGLITYQIGHKKTLDITLKLFSRGYHQIAWYAFPFINRDAPQSYSDRPAQIMEFDQSGFCRRYGVELRLVPGWQTEWADHLSGADVYLHCTSKIIPAAWIDDRIILNCHPGLLPKNRGVDAFKRSIVNRWPIGVTLHVIDEEIDRGTVLFRREVPVLTTDEYADICARAYEFECDMLANFETHLRNLHRDWKVGNDYPVSHKKIPPELDANIEKVFLHNRDAILAGQFADPFCPHQETYPA